MRPGTSRILIQQGLFREDLFFRLNVVPLRLPPLRRLAGEASSLRAINKDLGTIREGIARVKAATPVTVTTQQLSPSAAAVSSNPAPAVSMNSSDVVVSSLLATFGKSLKRRPAALGSAVSFPE